jgi:predicted HTH transcriptional regulator
MKFLRTVSYTNEKSIHTAEEFLLEVNRERSEEWTDYTMEDVKEYPEEIIREWMTNDYEEWSVLP